MYDLINTYPDLFNLTIYKHGALITVEAVTYFPISVLLGALTLFLRLRILSVRHHATLEQQIKPNTKWTSYYLRNLRLCFDSESWCKFIARMNRNYF